MAAERDEIAGLNLVGLRRREVPAQSIAELKEAFRTVYFNTGNIRKIAATALMSNRFTTHEARCFLEFFSGGKRGFARARREGGTDRAAD
jgi:UDP-N-acetylglucosamine acyltransferase